MGKVVIKKNWLATLTEMKMGDANMTHSNWSFSPLLRGKSVLGWAAPGIWDSERVPGCKGEPGLAECGGGGSLSLVAIWTITQGTRQLWRVFELIQGAEAGREPVVTPWSICTAWTLTGMLKEGVTGRWERGEGLGGRGGGCAFQGQKHQGGESEPWGVSWCSQKAADDRGEVGS